VPGDVALPLSASSRVDSRAMTPEVSGRALLGLLAFAKERGGRTTADEIVATLSPASRVVFGERIQPLRYYPYGAYVEVLYALKLRFGRANEAFFRRLGATAGERDLGTMFKVYVALASPERLIRSCARVWSSYYRNAGTMTAVAWEGNDTRLRIEGFDAMDRAHCELMEGWMIATMDRIGVAVARDARETACTSRGDAFHEFSCTWRRR
jgi:hypothetical protein